MGVILTAAHCLKHEHSWASVLIGSTNLQGSPIEVIEKVVHPLYVNNTSENFKYDFALLRLPQEFTGQVSTVTLNDDSSFPSTGDNMLTMGLGLIDPENDESQPSIIYDVELPYADDDTCKDQYKIKYNATTMVCAGDTSRGSCKGDSGSPLVYKKNNGEYIQVGVTSFGSGDCDSITVFSRVSYAYDWINEVACRWTGEAKFCENVNDATEAPVVSSTEAPIALPTSSPLVAPTTSPSASPVSFTVFPTQQSFPTDSPTISPTMHPSMSPTFRPTKSPTASPSETPISPTSFPTRQPTLSPSKTTFAPQSPPTNSPLPLEAASESTEIPALAPETDAPVREPTNSSSILTLDERYKIVLSLLTIVVTLG